MKKLKLFLSLLMLFTFSIGNTWGAVYFEDTFSNVGTGSSGSILPRDGWEGSGTCAPQYNTGVRLGASSSGATLTKTAMTSIDGTKTLKVTIYVAKYNTNANTLTITATNGTIATVDGVGTLSDGTLTVAPTGNAGVTSTTAAATWTNDYKTAFTITGASKTTTIQFSSNSRLVLGPVKIEDAPAVCSNTVTITKGAETNGTYTLSATSVCGDGDGEDVTISDIAPAVGYEFDEITTSASGTVDNTNKKVTGIKANTTITVKFKALPSYTVTWNVNGDESRTSSVYQGSKPTFPTPAPTSCDATSTTFIGWATEAWAGKLASISAKTVYTSADAMPAVTGAVTYYAVFAKAGGAASNLFSWEGGTKSELTAKEGVAALTADNSDYADSHAPYRVKWNTDGHHIIIVVSAQPGKVSFGVKKLGGAGVSTISVQESTASDGTFTDVEILSVNGASNAVVNLETTQSFKSTTRAIKLKFNKNQNVGLGPISIEGTVGYSDYMTTCAAPEPAVSVEPSPVAFGTVKQHDLGPKGTEYIFKNFIVTGENLEHNVVVAAPSGSIFALWNPETDTQIGTSIELTPDENGAVEKELAIMAATGWSGIQNGSFKITGTDIEDITVNITMTVTETFNVEAAVNDAEMGTATINGKSSVYTDGNDVLNIVATPKSGYEFVNWTVSDGEVLEVASATSATTTLTAIAEGTVTANFQAQACTSLAAPEYQGEYITYQSIRLVWAAVDNAASYLVNIKQGETPIVENVSTTECAYVKSGLTANTEYTITVMAVGSGTYCAENNPVLEKSYTLPDYPAATLAFSENGTARALAGDHKLKDVVKLPTEAAVNVYGKVLVGWTNKANKDYADDEVAPTVFYEKGADYTIALEKDTLYAVYALETPGAKTNYDLGSATLLGTTSPGNTASSGYTLSTNNTNNKAGYTQDSGTKDADIVHLQVKSSSDTQIIPVQPSDIVVEAHIGAGATKDPLDYPIYAVLVNNAGENVGDPVVLTTKILTKEGEDFYASMPVANYANVRGFKVYHMKEDGWNARYYTISLSYKTAGPSTFSKYSTTGLKQLSTPQFNVAAGTYTTAQNIELTAAEGDIYYTLDGSEPTKESTKYTAAIALDTYGEHTIKAFAATETGRSDVAETTYKLNLPFASLEALVAQELPSETPNVTVSFSNVAITDFGNSNKNVYLNVKDKDGENDILFFNYNALEANWVVGGQLSGTVTGTWKEYNSEWELVITSWTTGITYKAPAGIAWSTDAGKAYTAGNAASLPSLTNPNSLTVTYSSSDETVATISNEEGHKGEIAPLKAGTTTIKATFAGNESYIAKEVSYTLTVYAPTSVVITGDATKKEYFFNETFSFAGLGAKATYSDATDYVIPAEEITWAPAPAPAITANATIEVKATWQGLTSAGKEIAVTKVLRELSLDEFKWSDYTVEVILFGHSAIPAVRSIVNTHNLPVTYRSGAESKMEVNATTGEITSFKASGAVAMFVEFAGNEEYAAASRSYIIDIFGLDHVELSGDASKTAYEAGETFDHTGLVATAVYTLALEDPQNLDVTALAEWTATDIEANTTKVTATATWKDKSADKEVDVTVNLHEVTFADVENKGHVLVKLGDDNINSGDEFALGTELHVFAVPQDGYKATGITINGHPLEETSYEGEEIQVLAGQFIVGSEDIVIAATFEALPKYYLKNNWDGGSWTWKEMTPVSETNYILENVVFGGQGVNINTAASDEGAGWKALEWFAGEEIGALDTVTLALNPKTMVITATLLGKYIPANFYITGTAELVGGTGWQANDIAVKADSYTFKNLAVGSYAFKVTTDGTWNTAKGYDELSAYTKGLYRGIGQGDNNVCFILNQAGDVTITYTGEVFTVAGTFGLPTVKLVGSMNGWEGETAETLEPAVNGLTASLTRNLAMNNDKGYSFNMIVDGLWLTKPGAGDESYVLHREFNFAEKIYTDNSSKPAMWLSIDKAGAYTFVWTYATNTLTVIFPNLTFVVAGDETILGSNWNIKDEANQMTIDDGIYTLTKTNVTLNAGTYDYKIVGEGSWAMSYPQTEENAHLTVDARGIYDVTFTFNQSTKAYSAEATYKGPATGIDNTEAETKAVKFIKNGQIFILRGEKVYTVDGQLVK